MKEFYKFIDDNPHIPILIMLAIVLPVCAITESCSPNKCTDQQKGTGIGIRAEFHSAPK